MKKVCLLLLPLLVVLGSCADRRDTEEPEVADASQAVSASTSVDGAHVASITPGKAVSNRPTKSEPGRQTIAPVITEALGRLVESRSRLVVAPVKALAIVEPTACDWTSVASAYQDRSACRSGAAGSHVVAERLEGLDPHVASEIEDADAFGWGPRLLGRMGATLSVGDDVYVPTKGGTWTRCADVGPTDACGSNLWDQVTHGISAQRWEDGQLVEQWRRESSWIPPSIDNLSQQWEPVHQAAVSGLNILIPESHGRVSIVSRATGELVTTIASPATNPTILTAVSSGIAVQADGSAWYTVMDISPTNPFDTTNSWLVHAYPDGTTATRSILLLTQRDPLCVTTFRFGQYVTPPLENAKPWPPYIGAVGPTFPCRDMRPVLNATPAISRDQQHVYIVSRPYQNADHVQVTSVEAASMRREWTGSLRDMVLDGCGVLDPIGAMGSTDPAKCRYGSPRGIDKVTGLMPGGGGLDLAISSPVPTPDGCVLVGTYTPYDNERGHTYKVCGGHPEMAVNFGWNLTPGVRPSHVVRTPSEYRVIMPDSHYDLAPFRMIGADPISGHSGAWTHVQPGNQKCSRSGDIVDCVAVSRLPGTGQNNLMATSFSNYANSGLIQRSVEPGGFPFVYVPRSPVITGVDEVVWTYSTDGFASMLDGETGALLERVFVDSSLVQNDVAMSQDASGRVYVGAGGGVTVLAPSDVR